jgi:hypothetical protein
MATKKKSAATIKFKTILDSSGNGMGWHFISVSRETGERFPADSARSRRVVCTLNGREEFQCALMPSGGEFYIMVNKAIRTRLEIAHGHTVEVSLRPDDSKYGMPMPEELEEVLKQDPDGDRLFHGLTAGKRRSLMWIVGKGKDEDTRIHRALVVIEHLKDNDAKIVGEKLQQELKKPKIDPMAAFEAELGGKIYRSDAEARRTPAKKKPRKPGRFS